MINYNKLYSGLFSIVLIYVIMTTFELLFFIFIICPVITGNIHTLLNSFEPKSKNDLETVIVPNPLTVAEVLNEREYVLINNYNLGNYLIIVLIILFLISMLFFLYLKI